MASGINGAGFKLLLELLVSILVLVKYGLGGDEGRHDDGEGGGLNSCSGEVWPRGTADAGERDPSTGKVSILVLVKYGLGGRRGGRAVPLDPMSSQFLFW